MSSMFQFLFLLISVLFVSRLVTTDVEVVVRPLLVRCPDANDSGYLRSGIRFLLGEQPINRRKKQGSETENIEPYSPQIDLPWSCRCRHRLIDLGEHVIPRYVNDAVCTNSMCWYGHYYCLPIEIQQTVIAGHSDVCTDRRLPANLRSRYVLQTVSVNAGCRCGRR